MKVSKGHGGAARQSRRRIPAYLKEVLEPEITTITVQCQRCKKEGTAVRYRLKVKDLPDEEVQQFRRVVTPHMPQWLRPPPGWWAWEEGGQPPCIGIMAEPLRCPDCMAQAGAEFPE
jgi:hypothetical protein